MWITLPAISLPNKNPEAHPRAEAIRCLLQSDLHRRIDIGKRPKGEISAPIFRGEGINIINWIEDTPFEGWDRATVGKIGANPLIVRNERRLQCFFMPLMGAQKLCLA